MKRILILHLTICVLISLAGCSNQDNPVLPPSGLTCELQENPIGIDRPHPLLSWKIDGVGYDISQTAYQILVATNREDLKYFRADVWDSGKVSSDQSVFIPYEGPDLQTGRTYFWRVKFWDNSGRPSPYSSISAWETGLLTPGDFKAKWIGKNDTENLLESVLLRKEFTINKDIEKARLYVTGLGSYVFYINGEKTGADILTPGWTDYPKRIQYQTYDVTHMLKSGRNAMGAILGNCWWSGGLGWLMRQTYSDGPLRLRAQLEITTEDGEKKMFITNDTWKWHASPILRNSLYDGVHYDARLELPGWHQALFSDNDWEDVCILEDNTATLVSQQAPPIRITDSLSPVSINRLSNGNYVFDFGQNMAGWAKLQVNGNAGDLVSMRFAEILEEDGSVDQENLRFALSNDVYVLKGGGTETWEPLFTYSGFRYVEVEGLPEPPDENTLTARVFHSDVPVIGSFSCANPLINQIQKNIFHGLISNLMSVPTDCPQRDERLGWTGDIQLFAPTALYNTDLTRFLEKWLKDVTDSQTPEGYIFDVAPKILAEGPAKAGWGDAMAIVPYMTYKFTGNKRVLEENYDSIKKWVEYMRENAVNDLYIWQDDTSTYFGYGDWIAPEASPLPPISVSYYYYSTKLLSEIAGILDKNEDAETYALLAQNISKAYQAAYFDETVLNYEGETQTANLLPLAFGITPEALKEKIAENIADDVTSNDFHPTTGFLGTPYLLPMLSDFGYHDISWKLATQTTSPSWGHMAEMGATTIWEQWDLDTNPIQFLGSRNHYALGSIGEWFYGYLGGIQPDIQFPGFKRSIISPMPVEDLEWVKASIDTHYGRLSSAWRIIDDIFYLDVEIPNNTRAIVKISNRGKIIKTITCGESPLFSSGKTMENPFNIQLEKQDDTAIFFRVPSGAYAFITQY